MNGKENPGTAGEKRGKKIQPRRWDFLKWNIVKKAITRYDNEKGDGGGRLKRGDEDSASEDQKKFKTTW